MKKPSTAKSSARTQAASIERIRNLGNGLVDGPRLPGEPLYPKPVDPVLLQAEWFIPVAFRQPFRHAVAGIRETLSDVRVEGRDVTFSGELARQIREAAEKKGITTDEVIAEALTAFIAKNTPSGK